MVAQLRDIDEWTRGLGHLEGVGSNDWVVAGNHTQSGKPLVANDPHLGLSAPAIWYFARIKAPDGPDGKPMDVIGATLPGLPSVVLGRTAGVAWGFTNTGPDVQDLYLEQINRDNPKQYRTPQGWADFEQREEAIKVKGQPDEKLIVRTTRHGPVLSDANAGYADVIDPRRYALGAAVGGAGPGRSGRCCGGRAEQHRCRPAWRSCWPPTRCTTRRCRTWSPPARRATLVYQAVGRVAAAPARQRPARHRRPRRSGTANSRARAGWLPAAESHACGSRPRSKRKGLARHGQPARPRRGTTRTSSGRTG